MFAWTICEVKNNYDKIYINEWAELNYNYNLKLRLCWDNMGNIGYCVNLARYGTTRELSEATIRLATLMGQPGNCQTQWMRI